MADIEVSQRAEFLMTKLESVPLENLDPDDRQCGICQQEYCVSEDVKLSHPPVKTLCGHIFGKPCLIKWLDPLCYWGLTEGADPEISEPENQTIDWWHMLIQATPHVEKSFFLSQFASRWSYSPRVSGSGMRPIPLLESHGQKKKSVPENIFGNTSGTAVQLTNLR